MNLALANDEYYFPGLWSVVLSVLASTPDATDLRIYIIDTGISDESWQRLSGAVAKHPRPPELIRIRFPRERLDGLEIPGSRSPLVYARLFIPELLDCKNVLYLDSDLLVFKDVTELADLDLTDYACAAVINEDAGTLDFDLSEQEYNEFNLDPKSAYFNAGLLYMNLDYWREHDLTEKCIYCLQTNKFRLADQSVLNAVMNGKIKPLDRQWNRLVNHLDADEIVKPSCIVHYTSHKPWVLKSDDPAMLLWRKFTQDTGYVIEPPHLNLHICERFLWLNLMRTGWYGLMAIWHAVLKNTEESKGYSYAFSHWINYVAERKKRECEFRLAETKIRCAQYAPKWLLDDGSTSSRADSDGLPYKEFGVKGKVLNSIFRNRGRSRNFVGRWLQGQQKARLDDLMNGKKALRLSDRKSDIPVSLTSWLPRAETLPLVLLSLIEQSVRPSKIFVWICPEDIGMMNDSVRGFFSDCGVEIHEVSNIGPHKKWLPVLEMGYEDPFVIADDDTYYPSDWFEALVSESSRDKENIIAHRCHKMKLDSDHRMLSYGDWDKDVDYNGEASHAIFPTGCGGVMMRPKAISKEFRNRELIKKLCPHADDIWLKSAYLYSDTKCRKSRYHFPFFDYPETRKSGLAIENVDGGQNDTQLRSVLEYFDIKLGDLCSSGPIGG